MFKYLNRIKKDVTLLVLVTYLITPIVCLGVAIACNIITYDETLFVIQQKGAILFSLSLAAWVVAHFSQLLNPIYKWIEYDRNNQAASHLLHNRLRCFTRSYFVFFAFYALITPFIFNLLLNQTLFYKNSNFTFAFILIQLAVVYLIAMPAYILSVNKLGLLVRFLGLKQVFYGIKLKLWHIGTVIPLLSLGLLTAYNLTQTNKLDWGSLVFISIISVTVLLSTWLTIRSISASLLPVENLLSRTGASTNADLARLQAQSTDEISYLMQTTAKVFKRLFDQQSHIHAVVDTAAEGIIVVDDKGLIETFNLAAENLFGYKGQDARGLALSQFLPTLTDENKVPKVVQDEQEIEGVHRNGRRISMSVRVSIMQTSDQTMYTCLIADITARKAAQLKQKNAEARYKDLVETAHDLVWSMDANGKWTYLNKAAFNIYGIDPEEMIGNPISQYRDPNYAQQESVAFNEILKGKELYQFETVHLDVDGKPHHLSFNAKAHRDILGNVKKISGTARDISEKKEFEKILTFQAKHDALTRLHNRRYFQEELERVVARVTRSAGSCGLLYLDLDQFKYVNDTLGHSAGDQLLIEISELLKSKLREGELLSRFGGDEFTILLYNIDQRNLKLAADKFRNLLDSYRFLHSGQAINVTCSIGAVLIDSSIKDAGEALGHADLASHIAKSKGRNCVQIYDKKDHSKDILAADMGWAARVREMLEHDRFIQAYQPIVDIRTGLIHDYEVLIRMPCDDGQIILPGGFLDSAKRFGLIQSIDRWMSKRSIDKLQELQEQGHQYRFAINLSGHAFDDNTLIPSIRKWLQQTNVNPANLTFEITESEAIQKISKGAKLIEDLKTLGCHFSLDDFGSGYSSMNYLKHLPVDFVKIDGSFIKNITSNKVDQAMVESMIKIASALNIKTIAECVENAETYKFLKNIGIDYVQGNYLGEPTQFLIGNDNLPSYCTQLLTA